MTDTNNKHPLRGTMTVCERSNGENMNHPTTPNIL